VFVMTCPFCEMQKERIRSKDNYFYVVRDGFPVTELHTLIISNSHNFVLDNMKDEESLELTKTIRDIKKQIIEKDSTVTGFNIGINEGKDAGQTVMHFHCHVIPRRNGDIDDPRGGVRGVIPNKQKY
jgi:ATP adenylyltransferase